MLGAGSVLLPCILLSGGLWFRAQGLRKELKIFGGLFYLGLPCWNKMELGAQYNTHHTPLCYYSTWSNTKDWLYQMCYTNFLHLVIDLSEPSCWILILVFATMPFYASVLSITMTRDIILLGHSCEQNRFGYHYCGMSMHAIALSSLSWAHFI